MFLIKQEEVDLLKDSRLFVSGRQTAGAGFSLLQIRLMVKGWLSCQANQLSKKRISVKGFYNVKDSNMGFRFQKRINLGKGLGLNISKSGISPSFRTKGGTISNKGFSVRTGFPGVTYRKFFGKSKSGCMVLVIISLSILIPFIILKKF
jgi:hypothetical protein